MIALSIDYSEKKNKTPDNLKAENQNCMGFRNFTLKPFKIDPSKSEGFSSYTQLSEGWQNAVFTCLTTGFPTSVGRNIASGGCLQKKRRKLQVKVLFLIKKKKRPPTPKMCAFFFDLLFL